MSPFHTNWYVYNRLNYALAFSPCNPTDTRARFDLFSIYWKHLGDTKMLFKLREFYSTENKLLLARNWSHRNHCCPYTWYCTTTADSGSWGQYWTLFICPSHVDCLSNITGEALSQMSDYYTLQSMLLYNSGFYRNDLIFIKILLYSIYRPNEHDASCSDRHLHSGSRGGFW